MPRTLRASSVVSSLLLASAATAGAVIPSPGDPGGRGLPSCPDIQNDFASCHTASLPLAAVFSGAGPGQHRTIDSVTPVAANPTRLCWIGRYQNRAVPAVADEAFRVRIFNSQSAPFPDLPSGPIFDRVFRQSGTPGQELLELSCLDGQNCPGTTNPASGGHYVYSVEVPAGFPMNAMGCYWVEITCVGSAAAGLNWGWCSSQAGDDLGSFQAVDGAYTHFTRVENDRALCLSGGVNPFLGNCVTTIPPSFCDNPPENGQAGDGLTNAGVRSSSPGSIGIPPGQPNAWTPTQRAENFQVAAPTTVTNTCFTGFYLAVGCTGDFQAPEPTHDIEFYADVDGLPGGPAPIASFRLGTTPGVTYIWDGDELVSATHPPVELEPGRCYWLAISRRQGAAAPCNILWHWRLTATPSPAADRVFVMRDVSGTTPEPWQYTTVDLQGDTSISNLVYLFNGGPVAAPVCGDCNRNGVADRLEIAITPALDCFDPSVTGGSIFTIGGSDGLLDACQCKANWNRDGAVNSADISGFLTSWIDGMEVNAADFNCDFTVNSSDISTFLTAWLSAITDEFPFNGCP